MIRSLGRLGTLVGAAFVSLVLFGTGLVGAEPLERRLSGAWRLVDETSGASCGLHLHSEAAGRDALGTLFRADVTACSSGLVPAGASIAWRTLPQGGLELLMADGMPLAAFDVGERDGLASVAPPDIFLLLLPEQPVELSGLIPGAR
jgi:hypothetical protein